eukprot:scaffold131813_cov29-Tisochrysis_lutea.AAC.2
MGERFCPPVTARQCRWPLEIATTPHALEQASQEQGVDGVEYSWGLSFGNMLRRAITLDDATIAMLPTAAPCAARLDDAVITKLIPVELKLGPFYHVSPDECSSRHKLSCFSRKAFHRPGISTTSCSQGGPKAMQLDPQAASPQGH